MNRYVAFLRGINVGGHRVTNNHLCTCFDEMGFANAAAFLASGNVIFDADDSPPGEVVRRIEERLRSSLGYEVPTFLRHAEEVRAIASRVPFTADELERSAGKIQVALLANEPAQESRETVLGLTTDEDRLALHSRELYWLPQGGVSQSDLDFALIESTLGTMTVRTKRTVERIVAKHFPG